MAFGPTSVSADGKPLRPVTELSHSGYTLRPLSNGDYIVTIRHDGCRDVVVEGDDPQQMVEDDRLQYEGAWSLQPCPEASEDNCTSPRRRAPA